jgi:two-component system chemotaxis sensor kinase CheA
MLDMFIFETVQLIEQLEQSIIEIERSNCYTETSINEIFRVMHTIKSSSAMMRYENISLIAHTIEDLFYFLREEKPENADCLKLTDIVLEGADFIKKEIDKITGGRKADGDGSGLIGRIKNYLSDLKVDNPTPSCSSPQNCYKAVVHFEEGCEMENIRAFLVINNLKEIAEDVSYVPEDIIENDGSIETIRDKGFSIFFKADRSYKEMYEYFSHNVVFLRELELYEEKSGEYRQLITEDKSPRDEDKMEETQFVSAHQSIISVNVQKLDKLMDLVGELVISEAMVIQNPDLNDLVLDNFLKSSRQLQKITGELQDTVMSIRMVPLSATFQRMNRIVRDMSKKLEKEVRLEIIGEETEVDKNIIDHISDPLMHLIRNSIDHGIEAREERKAKNKPEFGTVTLEAKNTGGDVLIIVKDDGRGLDKEKILSKARKNGLIKKAERDLTDKEIYSFVLLAGFSTKEEVTEFSGRGVGMDVVASNIDAIGGTVSIDSAEGEGTEITLKMPLTLAIVSSMIIRTGKSVYSVPVISIRESFRARDEDIITDSEGNEMIMIRGQCYTVLRLYELYGIKTEIKNISDGIMLMVENDGNTFCIFADEIIGGQEVVVKALPGYIRNLKKVRGLSGCTLLGDGSISLILDIADMTEYLKGGRMKI